MSNDWIVYHSINAMRHSYLSLKECAVYSTTNRNKLAFNDTIWVIEGDTSSPVNYTLVDCFKYEDTDYPPFSGKYSTFKLKFSGKSLLLNPVNLSAIEEDWFIDLHQGILTNHKCFELLDKKSSISKGLNDLSVTLLS